MGGGPSHSDSEPQENFDNINEKEPCAPITISYPDYYVSGDDILQSDIDYAQSTFQIITSGFMTGPFVERTKDPNFVHKSTTTWFYEAFYEDFFRRCPDVRPMFANVSMFTQGKLLVGALSLSLDILHKPEVVNQRLRSLALRHNGLGVKVEHYGAFGDSLFAAMALVLGPLCDEPTKKAWVKLYSYMIGVMIPLSLEYYGSGKAAK